MSAIQTLQSNSLRSLEDQYLTTILKQTADDIATRQDSIYSGLDAITRAPLIANRKFTVHGNTLILTHPILQRFLDMKRLRSKKQKSLVNHNKIIYSEIGGAIRALQFGLTQDLKEKLAQEYKIHL